MGAEKFRISYSGGSLSAVMEMLAGSDSLTVLPYSVVFTLRRQYPVAALSIKIAHPKRNLGLLYRSQPPPGPAACRLRQHVIGQFETRRKPSCTMNVRRFGGADGLCRNPDTGINGISRQLAADRAMVSAELDSFL